MSASTLGRRYAKALLSLAEEQKQIEKIGRDLVDLMSTWNASDELRTVFENPTFSADVRTELLKSLTQKMGLSPLLSNLLRMLSDRRRMRFLPDLAEAYHELAEAKSGRVRAEVITAGDLPESYFTELQRTLESVTGKKVALVKRKDPSIIGGVVARVGDRVFDGSVRTRLSQIREGLVADH